MLEGVKTYRSVREGRDFSRAVRQEKSTAASAAEANSISYEFLNP
jgi:hypothetical protein